MSKKVKLGSGRCGICGANIGSSLIKWREHRKHCKEKIIEYKSPNRGFINPKREF